MSDNTRFKLSFRVNHPTISASEIVKTFAMPTTKRFQSVGEPRISPGGEILGGKHQKTSVGFEFHEHALRCDEVDIEDMILEELGKIDLQITTHLAVTGGRCAFILGIFTDEYIGLELGTALNDLLSASKIEIWFYIYGGKD